MLLTAGLCLDRYGANRDMVVQMLNHLNVKEPVALGDWSEEEVHGLVDAFIQ